MTARRFLFPAQELRVLAVPPDFVEHRVIARDGVVVRALELPAPTGARTVVHFHTNRETAESLADLAGALRAHGLGVVLVEYRGYGRSVVLSGASLGTGVAAEMARRGRGARLVLLAPYTSIPAVVEAAAPLVPAALFIEDRFETLAKAPAIAVPTLVIHGDADEIVPFWMGETLARTIRGAVLRRIRGGHHGDLFARDPELIAAIVEHAS